jgi:hypothetical protein
MEVSMASHRLFVPALDPEDIIRHLGKGVRHWKEGRSAYSLARTWFDANDYPSKVRALIDQTEVFRGATMVDGFFERRIELGDGGRPSQTDILTIARVGDTLAIIAVEGKVDEPFGEPIFKWLAEGEGRSTREMRLRRLADILQIKKVDEKLRYQLFHRSVSTAIEAERYCATNALLVVHSFCAKQSGLDDYKLFLQALRIDGNVLPEAVAGPVTCCVNAKTVNLYFSWVSDVPPVGEFWQSLGEHQRRADTHANEIASWIAQRSDQTN